jgi:hypothetical protein
MQIGMGFGKFLARVLFQELGVSVPSSVFHVLFITRSLHAIYLSIYLAKFTKLRSAGARPATRSYDSREPPPSEPVAHEGCRRSPWARSHDESMCAAPTAANSNAQPSLTVAHESRECSCRALPAHAELCTLLLQSAPSRTRAAGRPTSTRRCWSSRARCPCVTAASATRTAASRAHRPSRRSASARVPRPCRPMLCPRRSCSRRSAVR